ncbi:MAG: sigma-70 family RNA polymerase sigma factor [Cyanobacterium sp. T60_A2020_053]|nr:sigma-70 family RNA polymerase sigma factor [Cyanobacterium sp. T60_A2020_053]
MSKFYFHPENYTASSTQEFSPSPPKYESQTVSFAEKIPENNPYARDSVRLYLRDIGRIPLLTKQEEIELARKIHNAKQLIQLREKQTSALHPYISALQVYESLPQNIPATLRLKKWSKQLNLTPLQLEKVLQTGKETWANLANITVTELEKILTQAKQAKQQMINANLRLVVSIAKKYQNRGLDLLDLIQEGSLGLEKAVEKFDYTKGYHFSTYAYWWIRQGMTRAIATQSRSIRIPIHITERLNLLKKTQRNLSQSLGRNPQAEELALAMKMTTADLRTFLSQIPRSISLETKVGDDFNTELIELIETNSATPEENLMMVAMGRDLRHLLASLNDREAQIIRLRYGFEDGKSHSLSDTAKIMDLSRERVRQIQARALSKLQEPNNRRQLQDYLELIG